VPPYRYNANRGVMATAREREAKALELRKAGYTFEQIGKSIGVSTAVAQKAYYRVLERLPGIENREQMRRLEAERLDTLMRRRWQAALDGEESAFNQVLRLMERRAKLLGLDEPGNPNVTVILKILTQLKSLPEAELLDVLGYQPVDGGPVDSLPPAAEYDA